MVTRALEAWMLSSLEQGTSGKYAKDLAQLTVVIPSYNRQDFLIRQCAYWSGSGASLLILDGSTEPLIESLRKILTAIDITYIHSEGSFAERLSEASKYIRTPYAVLLGDDEFFLYRGLSKAVAKLNEDTSNVACMTQSLSFHLGKTGKACTYGPGYRHLNYEVADQLPLKRLLVAMSDYRCATNYAVIRSDVWSRSWGRLDSWSSPYAAEMQQGIVTLIWGKLVTINDIAWLRSSENSSINHVNFNRGLSFYEWGTHDEFESERQRFTSILEQELVAAHGIDQGAAQNIVKAAMSCLIKKGESEYVSDSGLSDRLNKVFRTFIKKCTILFFSKTIFWRLKSAIFTLRLNDAKVIGPFGDLKALTGHLDAGLFFDDESAEALGKIEMLISDFNRIRADYIC